MADIREKLLPGTTTTYIERGEKGFSKIEMLLDATGGLSLSQVCAVTGLEGSTIQNWVKRGWVAHPKGKKYEEIHIARILIINALKECIKLEHIALLMSYLNGAARESDIIRESELYNFLCEALRLMGQTGDQSRGGAESVVEIVIRDYKGPRPDSRARIRKALTVMIYACVCTDVKRRTEAMMGQILFDLEHPEKSKEADVDTPAETDTGAGTGEEEAAGKMLEEPADEPPAEEDSSVITRKTVSQALREWDISSVERIIIDHNEEEGGAESGGAGDERASNRPWYLRRGTK